MELFDLEVPIRSTGAGAVKANFKELETAATRTSAAVEQSVNRQAAAQDKATQSVGRQASAQERATQAVLRRSATTDRATQSATRQAAAEDRTTRAIDHQVPAHLKITRAIMAREAQERALAAATKQAARATEVGLARTAQDVQRASAAFKAGTISATDYKVALQFARQEAQQLAGTAGTLSSASLKNLNTVMAGTGVAAGAARQGLGTMRSSLASMVAVAIGARGTLGTLGSAVLQFAAGNAIAVGVVAGIAAVVLAFRALTRGAREQESAVNELRDAYKKLHEEQNKGPAAQRAVIDKDKAVLRGRIDDLERELELAKADPRRFEPGSQLVTNVETRLRRAREALRKLGAQTGEDDATQAAEDTETRIDALIRLVTAVKATRAEEAELRREQARLRADIAQTPASYRATAAGIEATAKAVERVTAIEDAFTARLKDGTKETKSAVDALKDRVALLVELSKASGGNVDVTVRLRAALLDLEAIQQKRNLTDAQTLTILKAREQAEARLVELTSANIPAPQASFGRPQEPLIPRGRFKLELPDFGPELQTGTAAFTDHGERLGQTFSDGIAAGIEAGRDRVAQAAGAVADSVITAAQAREKQIAQTAQNLGAIVSAGITASIVAGVSGGSITEALGSMVMQFGAAVIATGVLMQQALAALASLNPVVAIGVGAALVALGAALKGKARDAFTPGTRGASSLVSAPRTFRIGTGALTQSQGAGVRAPVPVAVNYIGDKSPSFERWLGATVQAAQARGV